jgi:hypothetical protein
MTEETIIPDAHEDEDKIDGCDVEIKDEDATLDEDLPAAEGGVS